MADNVTVDTLTGDPVVAADEIGGVQYQRVKLIHGADGVNDGDVASGNPFPVAGAVTVSGPVTINNAAGASAVNIQDGGNSITVDGTFWQATQPVSIAGTVTIAGAVTNAGAFAVQVSAALPAGANAIGKLAANSGVDIGDVDVTSQPARVRTTDSISAAAATDSLMNGLAALTPKFATISGAAAGDNQLVAAVASKKIRVLSFFLMSAGTVSAYVRDDAGSPVSLIGDGANKLTLVSGSGFVLPHNPLGWCETTSGEGLQINLSDAIGVAGCLSYVEI